MCIYKGKPLYDSEFSLKTKIPALIQNRRKTKRKTEKKKKMVAKIKELTRKTTNDIYYHLR